MSSTCTSPTTRAGGCPFESIRGSPRSAPGGSESSAGHDEAGRFDGVPHGGFYSREDLEEIVAFADRASRERASRDRHARPHGRRDRRLPRAGQHRRSASMSARAGASPTHVLNLEERRSGSAPTSSTSSSTSSRRSTCISAVTSARRSNGRLARGRKQIMRGAGSG